MHWLTWIGLIIIFIGTILTYIGQQKSNDKITELSQQNIKLAEKNAELAMQSLNQITGGDSWAYLSGGLRSSNGLLLNQPFGLTLNHMGDNPLHDLIIDIFEVEESTKNSHTLKKVFHKGIGALSKTISPEPLVILKLPDKKRVDFIVKLKARNAETTQHLIFTKKEDNYWATAMKVFKVTPNKDGSFSKVELFKHVDDGFPDTDLVWIDF